ncbi:fructose-bisphosphate aldolase class I [Patescibacteria group bacterium]|nr:fructose-bisphosphate aldolase class I [Patescibacteria group bacterium]
MIDLEACARSLVAEGKGLLALDESDEALDARFSAVGITPSAPLRKKYHDLLLQTPGIEECISGVLLSKGGVTTYAKTLHDRNIVPGIRADEGAEPMGESEHECLTKGLISLPELLTESRKMHHTGFAKWRALIRINGDHLPTANAVVENAKRLAMYARQVQEHGMVPIVEMEVSSEGSHSRLRAKAVTEEALSALVHALEDQAIDLSGVLVETSMVRSGKESGRIDSPEEVAADTLEVLQKVVPRHVLGIVFLSGGQTPDQATDNLRAIVQAGKKGNAPWPLTFCYARALQEEALAIWGGKEEHAGAAEEAFLTRLRKVGAAARGE